MQTTPELESMIEEGLHPGRLRHLEEAIGKALGVHPFELQTSCSGGACGKQSGDERPAEATRRIRGQSAFFCMNAPIGQCGAHLEPRHYEWRSAAQRRLSDEEFVRFWHREVTDQPAEQPRMRGVNIRDSRTGPYSLSLGIYGWQIRRIYALAALLAPSTRSGDALDEATEYYAARSALADALHAAAERLGVVLEPEVATA